LTSYYNIKDCNAHLYVVKTLKEISTRIYQGRVNKFESFLYTIVKLFESKLEFDLFM